MGKTLHTFPISLNVNFLLAESMFSDAIEWLSAVRNLVPHYDFAWFTYILIIVSDNAQNICKSLGISRK